MPVKRRGQQTSRQACIIRVRHQQQVNPACSFEACEGDDNVDDENMSASMKFSFDATPTGSRVTIITWFSSIEAMEETTPGMEEGLRASMPQLDTVVAG